MKVKDTHTKKGITIITLVTIILLILTGIIIVVLNGENGLISKVNLAKKQEEIISTLDEVYTVETETTYQINSIEGEKIQITIKIKNDAGIAKIITPEGNEITSQVNNKTQFAIDYEVTSGTDYIFKIQTIGSDTLKDYVLRANIEAKPKIEQNTSYTYPVLSKYGVEINKRVSIDFGDNKNNYYSLDNGLTWNIYTDVLKIDQECSLVAKTIVDGEITREDREDITLELADDAMGLEAYDKDESTYITSATYKYLDVDSDLIGKNIIIKEAHSRVSSSIAFIDSDGNVIQEEKLTSGTYMVPAETTRIRFLGSVYDETYYYARLYEIGVENAPTINVTKIYPKLKSDNSVEEGYSNIEIEYFETSIQRLYSLDGGTSWLDYEDKSIRLEYDGTIIYAKGIDKNGIETNITTYESTSPDDTLDEKAYDKDESTYATAATYKYLDIDSDVIGKNIIIKEKHGYTSGKIAFIDLDGNVIEEETLKSGTYTVPEETTRIRILGSAYNETYYYVRLYEIGVEI